MRETLAQAAEAFGFNPAEKRGYHGRWTHVGDVIKSMAGKESDTVGARLDAHRAASDRRHEDHPNVLDRAAEHLMSRADRRMDRKIQKQTLRNLSKRKTPRG